MVLSVELLALLGVKHKRELELRLIKSLYGLKQAGRLWNLLLHKTLVELGYCQCYTDSCLYFKRDAEMVVLELKDLGVVSKFLGIGFEYDKDKGWLVEQRQVIQDLLDKFGLASASAVRVPIGGENDNESEGDLLPKHGAGNPERPTVQTFQSLVGSLLWIARCTRPDIAFAAHRVTRRTHAPRVNDWRLAKKIARYLKSVETHRRQVRRRGRLSRGGQPERPTVQTFQSLIGSLLWITRCTRPDITFAVHRVTRLTHAPRVNDWRLAKKIARYLKSVETHRRQVRRRGRLWAVSSGCSRRYGGYELCPLHM
ncbi:Pol Polyprotein [Phytophthora megakarya]|uniref:Pol Polyprotein n=1 Tax=Phytophthora megakarya TaxID=4795 RepID=A0A225WMT4_9STRA|nr:Pol Polyprotein [Phytophthora megakarya]